MSRSWGHELERLSEQEMADLRSRDERESEKYEGHRWYDSVCRLGRIDHREPATHRLRYSYVTGRAGRVSYAEKIVCGEHARKFAAKHGLDFDSAPEGEHQAHATERAFAELQGNGDGAK